nr:signal peptidase complex subunit spc3 [Quercus suber]
MHSSANRIQQAFGFFTSVAFAVAAVVAVSVLLSPQAPSAKLRLKDVQVVKGRPHYYSTKREEYAHVKFDLDADLTSLFNWNTKQVFLYITASYPSASGNSSTPPSEAVIWDAIIPSALAPRHPNTYIHPDKKSTAKSKSKSKSRSKNKSAAGKAYPAGTSPGIVRLDAQKPKYQITDITGKIAERPDAVLTLHWNVQPWVGALVWDNRQTVGLWKGLDGGEHHFSFPALKGTEVKKEDLRTETGAERNRGSPA